MDPIDNVEIPGNRYTIFTSILSYKDWINLTIRKNYN